MSMLLRQIPMDCGLLIQSLRAFRRATFCDYVVVAKVGGHTFVNKCSENCYFPLTVTQRHDFANSELLVKIRAFVCACVRACACARVCTRVCAPARVCHWC